MPEDVALSPQGWGSPSTSSPEGTAWILVLPISRGCSSTASLVLQFHPPFGFFSNNECHNFFSAPGFLNPSLHWHHPCSLVLIPVFQSEG